jgi:hypothetical protein
LAPAVLFKPTPLVMDLLEIIQVFQPLPLLVAGMVQGHLAVVPMAVLVVLGEGAAATAAALGG